MTLGHFEVPDRQIEPFAVENIEEDLAEPVRATRIQVGLQIIEAREAARILDDDLPVDPRRAATECLQCVRNARKE